LLQGYKTKSVEGSSGLWQLSRIVNDSTILSKVFRAMDPGRIVGALGNSDEGRAFLVRLRAYLDQFGWRSDGIYARAKSRAAGLDTRCPDVPR
jgi:hypothetical protein